MARMVRGLPAFIRDIRVIRGQKCLGPCFGCGFAALGNPWLNSFMSADRQLPPGTSAVAEQAALWLARRDRGLTPAEQDDYMQWLTADPRHAEAMTQHAAAFERMMHLYEWQPANTTVPNPDLFAPGRSRSKAREPHGWRWAAGLAAAAALVLGFSTLWQMRAPAPVAAKSYLRVNERVALPDGSRVELKDGSKMVVQYSATERRVKLTGGEAQFSVWKDAARPFIVEAAGVEVRAVGTVFNVRLESNAVDVLVTEGRVGVAVASAVPPTTANAQPSTPNSQHSTFVSAGERTTIPLAPGSTPVPPPPAVVTRATPEEIHEALAWQAPRLQFFETPLAEAVAEFNRLNRHQLVLGEPALGDLRIGGTFRPDNVEGFVRLLGTTLEIRAEAQGENRLVLRRR